MYGLADRLDLDDAYYELVSKVLPASVSDAFYASPLMGWSLLTIGCSGWLMLDYCRSRNRTGGVFWATMIFATPALAILHAVLSAAVAWPGCMIISGTG
jgi:hypothetical protein